MSGDIDLNDGNWLRYPDAQLAFQRGRRSLQYLRGAHPEISIRVGGIVFFNRERTMAALCRTLPIYSSGRDASEAPSSGQSTAWSTAVPTIFTEPLLEILPPTVQAKIRRIESDGNNADLLVRAARYLDEHGASLRFHKNGVRPAHVVPAEPVPTGSYSRHVADVRERIALTDEQRRMVETGSLADAWRDLALTDIAIVRLALERVEEAIITAADDHGVFIERRSDIDVAAFLEIERV